MEKSVLKKYAALIAGYGLNVQEGQDVLIQVNIENQDFALLCVEECYRLGARKVIVDWLSQDLDRLNYNYRSLETLSEYEEFEKAKLQWRVDKLPCLLWLDSDDPDGLSGVDMEKVGTAMQKKGMVAKTYRDQMDGKYQWCIAAVPGKTWAKKLFPALTEEEAIEKLWENILLCSRVTEDPVASWKEHDRILKEKCEYLNNLGIESLHYTSKEGTDLTVGFMADSIFMGGGESSLGRGVYFQPNIPSEECFTSPKSGEAEGIVYATMPLSYQGNLIENFWIRFENGKAIECGAEKNKEILQKILDMDEGASKLGECALVPNKSPIRKSGILFYNTLFDENATCHLALGAGFD
ncbi:MAG: aminopeptidase, partial [Candidatus Ornithospirochaeta sp.]